MSKGLERLSFSPVNELVSERNLVKSSPLSFCIWNPPLVDTLLVRACLLQHGFQETASIYCNNNLIWCSFASPSLFKSLKKHQKINRFPKSNQLSSSGFYNLVMQMKESGLGHKYSFVPKSYQLPQDYDEFYTDYLRYPGSEWIVKPSSGHAIVIDSLVELPTKTLDRCLIQKRIPNGLVYKEHSWSLSLFVAVTSFSPLRVHIYKEGLARFSTVPFSLDPSKMSNRLIHLTNYSI